MESETMSFKKVGEHSWVFTCECCDFKSIAYDVQAIMRRGAEVHKNSKRHTRNVKQFVILPVEDETKPEFINKIYKHMTDNHLGDYAEALIDYKRKMKEQIQAEQILIKEQRDKYNEIQESKHSLKTSIFRQIKELDLKELKMMINFIDEETGMDFSMFEKDPIDLAWLYNDDIETLHPDTFEYKFSYVAKLLRGEIQDDEIFRLRDYQCCRYCTILDEKERREAFDYLMSITPANERHKQRTYHEPPAKYSNIETFKKVKREIIRLINLSDTFMELSNICFQDINKKNIELRRNGDFIESLYHKPSKKEELFSATAGIRKYEPPTDDDDEEYDKENERTLTWDEMVMEAMDK